MLPACSFRKRVHDHKEVGMTAIYYSIFTEARYICYFCEASEETKLADEWVLLLYLCICNWFFREEFCHMLRRP